MKDPALTVELESGPLAIESTARALLAQPTPLSVMYVRNNCEPPTDTTAWSVEVTGATTTTSFSLAEIFDLPRVDLMATLQCAGNGRARLRDPVPGVQWNVGGVACPDWSGVRLGDLVERWDGEIGDAAFVTVLGGDEYSDDPNRVERSIPLGEALERALIVDMINGEPLPLIHGGPIRFVMPGYFAVNSVKWVRRIAFTADETDADIQRIRYRLVPPEEQPGSHHPTAWSMPAVALTLEATRREGGVAVAGIAFTGGEALVRVEVSADGTTWVDAELAPSHGRFAWRRFDQLIPGRSGRVFARVVTPDGSQPQYSIPNRDGYSVDGWRELSRAVDAAL